MLFNSLEFALFLPIVFILYWYVFNRNLKLQNLFIVFVSYIFYGWWDWSFLGLIAFTSVFSFTAGIAIELTPNNRYKKLISIANLLINLGILGLFKYYNFFANSFCELANELGIPVSSFTLNIILPVGISFYTFQALSYSIDVYNGKLKAERNLITFLAYVSFFPQLVAGPIERATQLLPQFSKRRVFNYEIAADGSRQILWGLFKKIFVADNCAIIVNTIFEDYQNYNGSTLLIGAFLFTFQIYGDFSGYSDIAIGVSKLFGFDLMRNFNYPYFSRDIAEFWRRWHISLSTWFRDYLYIPLGGSRNGLKKSIRNTLIIFTVSGLWHGANWTFIVWGLYHGILFLPLLIINKNRLNKNIIAEGRLIPSLKESIQMITTFSFVVLGWIFFRAESINDAFRYLDILFSRSLLERPQIVGKTAIMSVILLIIIEWIERDCNHGLIMNSKIPYWRRWAFYYTLGIIILLFGSVQDSFIYFQF